MRSASVHAGCIYRAGFLLILALLTYGPICAASDPVVRSGSFLRTLIPAVAYGATFYLHDKEGRSEFYKSFFTNYAATYALKQAISKTRPNGKDDESFPSGHTSVAFQGAAFIHLRYGIKYAVPAYMAATYVGWTRVESDNHYVVDVVAGAALGIISSAIFTRPYHGYMAAPLVENGFYGISISRQW
jgi:membrane-associated phospholipid phosphatase